MQTLIEMFRIMSKVNGHLLGPQRLQNCLITNLLKGKETFPV